ncbi:MAG: DUF4982 domain-containing protein [Muribaculaceae bacterium]|nr:DUF4982 domain-containing protein [Muribaculaceae bacterium]
MNKFVPFLLCALSSLSLSQTLGAETITNLGNTPWKFSKIVKNDNNLATKALVCVGPKPVEKITDGDFKTSYFADKENKLTIIFPEIKDISSLTLHFSGDSISAVALLVEGSVDGQNWMPLNSDKDILECQKNISNEMAAIDDTYGFIQNTESTYVNIPVRNSFRQLRLYANQPIAEVIAFPEIKEELTVEMLSDINFDDSEWEAVGIPHCFNEHDSFLNSTKGELCWRGEAWYRKKVNFHESEKNKKFFLRFNGVNIGATVYVNGHPVILETTEVEQPDAVTHIGSSIPFAADITPFINWGEENQIAVRVSNSRDTFFTYPGFAENEGFGQAMGGIVSPVYLYSKEKVFIPINTFAPHGKWGTYFGTVKANREEATLRFITNVENASGKSESVTLVTELKDKSGNTVLSFDDTKKAQPGQTLNFDFSGVLKNPELWYPNGSPNGSPYLYSVVNSVYVDGKLSDQTIEKMGIREITWDKDYCYVNGEKTILQGFGYRNIYPGLGAALPVDFRREDMLRIAECGGNALRVGHQPPFYEAIEACDEYGIMIILDSGDNEWSLRGEPASTYKYEYDRDAIVAFRNHPSVVVWESNNGLPGESDHYLPSRTLEQVVKYDFIAPRIVLNRDNYPPGWDSENLIVVGYTNKYEKVEGSPSLNTEVYGTNWSGNPSFCIARHDYDNEVKFSQFYVDDYLHNLDHKACGWIDWMLTETYGEGYTIYLNGKKNQKSLGSCAMDGNRFPKLKYRIYRDALWNSYEKKPGVALQSHWNFKDTVPVNAWSNCPAVELFVNGVSKGVVIPHPSTRRCTWENIPWEAGTLTAVGLDEKGNQICSESVSTAGEPYAIDVKIEKTCSMPEGEDHKLLANGSDAFIVTAKIVDKDGNWCPFADNNLTFNIEGEGKYKGSYNFYITENRAMNYHAPGDNELQAEGGLMRAAVRTTFNAGEIKVKVSSPGLKDGSDSVVSHSIN